MHIILHMRQPLKSSLTRIVISTAEIRPQNEKQSTFMAQNYQTHFLRARFRNLSDFRYLLSVSRSLVHSVSHPHSFRWANWQCLCSFDCVPSHLIHITSAMASAMLSTFQPWPIRLNEWVSECLSLFLILFLGHYFFMGSNVKQIPAALAEAKWRKVR